MQELCKQMPPFSSLVMVNVDPSSSRVRALQRSLDELIRKGLAPADAHLLSGVQGFDVNKHGELVIYEKATLYPSPDYAASFAKEFLPSMSVNVHCFDPRTKVCGFQIRGKGVKGTGKIQMAAAGFGKYDEHPADSGLRELKEEFGVEGTLVLPQDQFLTIVPGTVGHCYLSRFPNISFSYIATADLDGLRRVTDFAQIRELIATPGEGEVGHKFGVHLEDLRRINNQINEANLYYGPVAPSVDLFDKWTKLNL